MAVTQLEIARRVGLDVSSVNKILHRRKGPVFKDETIKQVFRAASDLGYPVSDLIHKRSLAERLDELLPKNADPKHLATLHGKTLGWVLETRRMVNVVLKRPVNKKRGK